MMKYRPTEKVIVNTLEKEIDKVNRKLEKLGEVKQRLIDKHEVKVDKVTSAGILMQRRIYKINDRVKKRCKHEGETHHRRNWRDDVSYTHRIICDDCGEQIGNYGTQAAYG